MSLHKFGRWGSTPEWTVGCYARAKRDYLFLPVKKGKAYKVRHVFTYTGGTRLQFWDGDGGVYNLPAEDFRYDDVGQRFLMEGYAKYEERKHHWGDSIRCRILNFIGRG